MEHRLELALDLLFADGLAVAFASALWAEVVGVASVRAFGPASCQRRAAVSAQHEPAQREVFVAVRPLDARAFAVDPILNLFEGLERDQPFMLSLAQRYVPVGRFDVSCINGTTQKKGHTLIADDARAVLGEQRMVLQEPHYIRLGVETA